MNREHFKKIASLVVGITVGFTVNQLIKGNVPVTKTHQKVEVFLAAYVLADMVAEKAIDHADRTFDRLAKSYDDIKR
jgi:uncharacterized membrane-anchored protein YhcB (DUF1043 family)